MSYSAYRKLIAQPKPNVVVYDYKDHPWYAASGHLRFEARLVDGNGSVGLRGATADAAMDSLTRHLCKQGTHTWADGTCSFINKSGEIEHLTVEQQDALHYAAMEDSIDDTGFYEHP